MVRKHNSTSSIQTEELNRSQEVVELGKRIVDELGLNESVDTLSKWMAHYLASMIDAVEKESDQERKSSLQKACSEVILELWERRSRFPDRARPAGRLTAAISALEQMLQDFSESQGFAGDLSEEGSSPWFQFASDSYSIERKIWEISFLAGSLELELGCETAWIEDHDAFLDDEERDFIRLLNDWMSSFRLNRYRKGEELGIEKLSPEERDKALLEEVQKAFDLLKGSLEKLKSELQQRDPEA